MAVPLLRGGVSPSAETLFTGLTWDQSDLV